MTSSHVIGFRDLKRAMADGWSLRDELVRKASGQLSASNRQYVLVRASERRNVRQNLVTALVHSGRLETIADDLPNGTLLLRWRTRSRA